MFTSAEIDSLDTIAKVLAMQRLKGAASVTRHSEDNARLTLSIVGRGGGGGLHRMRTLAAGNFEDARLEIVKAIDLAVAS